MIKIQDFFLDRNKSIKILNQELKDFIQNFTNSHEINTLLGWISSNIKISTISLKSDTEIFIFKQFINVKGKFNKNFSLKKILKDSIKFLLIFFYIRFFSTRKDKELTCELCIDDISDGTSPKRFDEINNLCDAIFISSSKLHKKYKTFIFKKYFRCIISKDTCNNYVFYLKLFFKTLVSSIKIKVNLFPLIIRLILTYIKYETVFNKVKAKFLIQERHYGTSAIKNEIFHKYGGKISSVIQKNILQINGPGMYINTDLLFALGENTAEHAKKLGGNIQMIVPVGSLFMERELHKRNEKNNFQSFDLMVFSSNHIGNDHSGYNSYFEDYYTHFNWIKKFAVEFPNLNICIKLKKILTDKKVKDIFDNLKNVHIIVDKSDKFSDTYFIADKAKALCTWSSTLGFEFIGYGKECYFLDPNLKNTGFIPNDKYILPAKVKEYIEFKNKIVSKLRGEVNEKILVNKKKFCYPSENVSIKILKTLRTLENDHRIKSNYTFK